MYTLKTKTLSFSVEESGRVCSLINLENGRENIKNAGETWKLIYSEGIRTERPVYGDRQHCSVRCGENEMVLR